MIDLDSIDPSRPVLIAGPTASGKSALALEISAKTGGAIVNADAIQVFDRWRILTARPAAEDERQAPHALYGHVGLNAPYSVGDWLRDVAPYVRKNAIIVGGTGLYFRALTEGLADIPATPNDLRKKADAEMAEKGVARMAEELDAASASRIDLQNPMRVQRAWEVLRLTGRGIADWQDATPAPLLPLHDAQPLVLNADRDWLNARIALRFEMMLDAGVLDEAASILADWDPQAASAKAIGAYELIEHLQGRLSLREAREQIVTATRQYAKRQRTWFRARMKNWRAVTLPE